VDRLDVVVLDLEEITAPGAEEEGHPFTTQKVTRATKTMVQRPVFTRWRT
jgi:hypothetical protein